MLSKTLLMSNILLLSLAVVVAVVVLDRPYGLLLLIPQITLLGLYMSIKEQVLTVNLRQVFDNYDMREVEALKEQLKSNPALYSAVEYIYGLTPKEMLTLGRLVVEMRNNTNKAWFSGISGQSKKELK